jgi:hypothetical protein
MLKTIVRLSFPLLLSACGTTAHIEPRFYDPSGAYGGSYLAPSGLSDPRLRDPHFYMDDDAMPRWFLMTPQPNR